MTATKQNKSILNQLAKGTGIAFLMGTAGYFLMFFFKLIAARYFGPEEFGLYEMTNTIMMLVVMISIFGIPAGIPRYIPRYENKNEPKLLRGYLRFAIFLPLFVSILLSIALFIFAPSLNNFFNFPEEFTTFLRIISLVVPFRVLSQVFQQIFLGKNKVFYRFIGNDFIEKILLLISISLVYFLNLSLTYLVFFLAVTIFLVFILNTFLLKTRISFQKSEEIKYDNKNWLSFSAPLFLTSFFVFVINWSDNILIGKFLDPRSVGIYAIIFSIATFTTFFRRIIVKILLPVTTKHHTLDNNQGVDYIYKKASSWIFISSSFIFTTIVLLGQDFLKIVYGNDYSSGFMSLVIISAGLLIFTSFGINEPMLIMHKKTKSIFGIEATSATINILLNISLIPILGISGAALSTGLTRISAGFFAKRRLSKIKKYPLNRKLQLKTVFAITIIYVAFSFLKFAFPDNFISLLFQGFLILITYLFLIYSMKILDSDDKMIFKKILRKNR